MNPPAATETLTLSCCWHGGDVSETPGTAGCFLLLPDGSVHIAEISHHLQPERQLQGHPKG